MMTELSPSVRNEVRVVDPATSPLWRELVLSRPSSVFHSPDWMRVLRSSHDLDVEALLLLDDQGAAVAGAPFAHVTDLRGERIVCLPFSDHCDPLVRDRAAWDALSAALGDRGCPVTVRTLRNDVARSDRRFQPAKRAKWHGLDLRRDPDELWRGIAPEGRNRIRQAKKRGLAVRPAETEADLRRFYDILLRLRKRKYGLLCQPFGFFQAVWRHFIEPGNGVLLLAEKDGAVVAGSLYLAWNDALYYKYNASEADALALRPNDLLLWEGIAYGAARGLPLLDFGLSDSDQPGLVSYKRKFADQERELWFQRWVPDARWEGPAADGAEVLEEAVRLLTRPDVPDEVTERAGAAFYRYFA